MACRLSACDDGGAPPRSGPPRWGSSCRHQLLRPEQALVLPADPLRNQADGRAGAGGLDMVTAVADDVAEGDVRATLAMSTARAHAAVSFQMCPLRMREIVEWLSPRPRA